MQPEFSARSCNDYRAPSTSFGEIGFTLTREIYPKTLEAGPEGARGSATDPAGRREGSNKIGMSGWVLGRRAAAFLRISRDPIASAIPIEITRIRGLCNNGTTFPSS